jgi:hypothetical protein
MYSGSLAGTQPMASGQRTKRFDSTGGDELLVSERGTVPSQRQE